MTKKTSAHAIADLPPGELEERVEKVIQHLDAIDALMADAVELSDEERRSALRLSGEDEVKALSGVLAFADARPELFKVLATDDDGSDPAVFETKLLATRLKNADTLSKLVARFAETTGPISDSALYVATLAKRPALLAYELARPYQTRDREYGKYLNDAVNLYRGRAMAGVQTRRAKKVSKTA
jgi:hypothetical protein